MSNTNGDSPEPELSEAFDAQKITELVAAFYRRVRHDDVIGPMYPDDDWDGAEQRLRDFLVYRFGGSDKYIHDRGHPRLGMRHATFSINLAARDRWLALMTAAMDEVSVPKHERLNVQNFFQQVAEFLRNQ